MGKIGITLGDPSGIGPEVVAKAMLKFDDTSNFILIGNRKSFYGIIDRLKLHRDLIGNVEFVDVGGLPGQIGKISSDSGKIALRSIETAVDMVIKGEIIGICTAPINKEAIVQAGSNDIDHTTMLARLTKVRDVLTLFETLSLRVTFATKHMSLKDAISNIDRDLIEKYIRLTDIALKLLGSKSSKIAVSALNPHAGDGGLFGREEIDIISPAVQRMKDHFNVFGPYPADSVFHRAALGEFDAVISLFHDQGHIACKMLDFEKTVSMNIGLPFLRTSVDHGTALEIAGKGLANETSMYQAIETSLKYSEKYIENYRVIGWPK